MAEKPKYPDSVLYQQIDQYFKPAAHWERCTHPLTSDQFFAQIEDMLPGFFDSREQLIRILKSAGFKYSHNEHNNKYYWLVNSAG